MKAILVLLSAVLFVGTVQAKEMTSRLGLGVKNTTSVDLPSLSMIYFSDTDIALTAGLGIDTQKDYSKFAFNAGIRRIVFKEDHMNFFMGGELGLVNKEVAGTKESGFELSGLFGAEFFFAGLDNLGFSLQGGVGVVSMKEVRFRTVADAPLQAAVTFYF